MLRYDPLNFSDYDSGLDALSALESLEAFPTSSKDTDVSFFV